MPPRHYSQTYRELRDVDPTDYQRIIRMYEEREHEIGRLDVLENFELTLFYVDALFETGAYRKHAMMVDLVLHAAIRYDIREAPGYKIDVFEGQLFRKAAGAYRLQHFDTAEHVLRELISMRPEEDLYVTFLGATLFRKQRRWLQAGRAMCISAMLLTAVLVTINLLIVRNFFPDYATLLGALAFGSFIAGMLALLGMYGAAYLYGRRKARVFRAEKENKRRS